MLSMTWPTNTLLRILEKSVFMITMDASTKTMPRTLIAPAGSA